MRPAPGPRRAHLPGASRRNGHVRAHDHGSRRRLTSRFGHHGVGKDADPAYPRSLALSETNVVSGPVVTGPRTRSPPVTARVTIPPTSESRTRTSDWTSWPSGQCTKVPPTK